MENKTNDQQINTSPVPPLSQPVSPAPNSKLWLVVGILAVLLLVSGGTYYLGIKNNSSMHQPSPVPITHLTTTITPITSPIINSNSSKKSVENETNKYTSKLGFAISYPKFNKAASTCEERQTDKTGIVPLKVFEDPSTNSFFISEESVIEVKNKLQSGGGYAYDFSTCKVVPNSLDLIKNGYDNGMTDSNGLMYHITKPNAFQFNYKKVENDNDLNDLLHTMYGPKCFVNKKEADKDLLDVFDVKFADKNGNNGFDGDCVTNYGYYFYYAPKLQIGIISSGFQNPPFNGSNGQNEPKFDFFPAQ